MLRYTLVVSAARQEDANLWCYLNVDTSRLKVAEIIPSAFLGHMIVKMEGDLDRYNRTAFEASLNYEVNDQGSDLIWWNTQSPRRDP